MTEKRFEYKNHKVFDNLTGETHSSNMVSVNVLNTLHEEKEFCKTLIELANALIDDLGSETLIRHWEGMRDEKYEEWRKLE